MDQAVAMQMLQGAGERQTELNAFLQRQAAAGFEIGAEGARGVGFSGLEWWNAGMLEWWSVLSSRRIVRQFHDIVEMGCAVVAADLEDVDEAIVGAGDGLVFLDAFKFALERIGVAEITPINNFHGSECADDVARQPNFAVTTAADFPQQLVIGNHRWNLATYGGLGFASQSLLV